ncbi:class I SAM-dependent methyltransferase [Kribbella sp. NBC_01245]|uniref:class I SAM-dependent methyltransferase n=1 Tax=Kribbella sp. NBC_01245 TaxID=2903578 RepID=UPI002E2BC45D|nr:class I SAM-dependent methyltransferase [Kribbella sp. NBC_01245]
MSDYRYLLFPGRHHVLTRFQASYLREQLATRLTPDAMVIWAVTSANHHTTKRNPVPFNRREAAIERFSVLEDVPSLVIPVVDTPPTEDFAEVTVKAVTAGTDDRITPSPADTLVACSTPEVSALYEKLGFEVVGIELDSAQKPLRPWDILLMVASGNNEWREEAHPATVDVFDRYRLDLQIVACVNDPVVGDDGGLTTTRDYKTYAEAFETAADRKWLQIKDFVRPGRILDIGCATGATLELVDRDPRFHESDLIGVEVARHLFAECEHKKAQGLFTNPNVFFYQRNMLGSTVFSPRSIDTTLTLALTHEIWSYAAESRPATVARFAAGLFAHTAPNGVWINSDVCGPSEPDRKVALTLDDSDGSNPAETADLTGMTGPAAADVVGRLSTRARFVQFARDFRRNADVPFAYSERPDGSFVLRLADAMDFLTRKDYVDNWLSETHEQFCGLTFDAWCDVARTAGFTIDPASTAWRNDWIIDNRIAPVAAIANPLNASPLPWPTTHQLLVARRPA